MLMPAMLRAAECVVDETARVVRILGFSTVDDAVPSLPGSGSVTHPLPAAEIVRSQFSARPVGGRLC